MRKPNRLIAQLVILVSFQIISLLAFAEEVNPHYFYMLEGQPVGERGLQVGDPDNWSTAVENRTGQSKSGKVTVSPTDFKSEGDAIQITWSPKVKGQGNFGIYGQPFDLSAAKDQVSLTIDMRVDARPNSHVGFAIDCGYPCRAELPVKKMLKSFPVGEWFSLPLPLNCFKGDNFDLSKIGGPLTISTDGKLSIAITNVRLELLPEGDSGCKE